MVPLDANASLSWNTHGHQCCNSVCLPLLNSCATLAVMTDLLLLDVFCFFFCFPFSPPVLVHLFVRKEKKNKLKKIQPGMFAHWAVFSALCHAIRMHEVVHNTTNKWTIEGLTQWEVPKQTNKQTNTVERLVGACKHAMYPSHGDLLLDCCSV